MATLGQQLEAKRQQQQQGRVTRTQRVAYYNKLKRQNKLM